MRCPQCGGFVEPPVASERVRCDHCKNFFYGHELAPDTKEDEVLATVGVPRTNAPSQRYSALYTVSSILGVLGIVTAILAVLGAAALFKELGFAAFGIALWGVIASVGMFALSELIKLLIDIEGNTRRTAESLERLHGIGSKATG